MLSVGDLFDAGDTLRVELYEALGLATTSSLPLRTAEDVGTALAAARIACLSSDEAYYLQADADFRQEVNPRNEAASIALLYTKLREAGDKAGAAALSAHAPGVSKAAQRGGAAPEDSGGAGPRGGGDDAATTLLLDADAASADAAMMRWAEEQGIRARMRPASFGGLRGAAAAGAIWADEPAVEVPASALITLRTALESDIGPLLKILPGLDSDTALTLWTMYDRVSAESPRAPFWKALPETIATGVTMPLGSALKGLPVAEEARVLRGDMEARHAQLFPALFKAAPGLFDPPEAFSLDAFLWASQLWMAYAIKVLLPGEEEPEPALVPVALLANHALRPDIVRFSRVDDDGVLRLRVIRGVPDGAEVSLSYGPLPNAQLLLFYGFALRSNPFDSIQLAFDLPTDDNRATAKLRAAVLRWAGLGLDDHAIRAAATPLSPRLLTALRLLSAAQAAIGGLAAGNGVAARAAAGDKGTKKEKKQKAEEAAVEREEEEEGPDPAAAAGTREASRRAAAVEAACGSRWAANALKATVDSQSAAVAACLAAAAKRAASAAVASASASASASAASPGAQAKGSKPAAATLSRAAGGGAGATAGVERLDASQEDFVRALLEGQKACLDAAAAQIALLEGRE